MRNRTGTLVAVLVAFAAGGAVVALVTHRDHTHKTVGSGVATSVERAVPAFSGVELSGTGTVHVRPGPLHVTVSGDDNVVPLVTTEVHGDTLVIDERRGSISTHEPIVVEVRTPAVTSSSVSGSGQLTVVGVDTPSFDASLSGSGGLDVDGTVDVLHASVSGVGSAALEHLVAHDATVDVSGVGSAHVVATDALDASVSGVGSVLYGGNPPQVTKRVSGVGSVTAG